MVLSKLAILTLLPLHAAAETILGVYIFSRHGDRTAKATPPSSLTDLGFQEIFTSGTWFRNRYIASSATSQIAGISNDLVKFSELAVSAPLDDVLMPSAIGFTQGLYPPIGASLGSETLGNGTTVQTPLNGLQLIPITSTSTGASSEGEAWVQGSSNCANAIISSNNWYFSQEYQSLLKSTQGFYNGVFPMINSTFTQEDDSFKNAYTIFDYLNVASIHNATWPSKALLTPETFFQLRTLADNHEYNLAYNATDPIRAVAGATLAAQVVQGLNSTITSVGKTKVTIQFGAYNSFQSYFGLANLSSLGPDWIGVPDYASTMTWELFTNGSADPFPSAYDLNVRFLFHNGTTSNISTPTAYPLFGGKSVVIPWNDFVTQTNKFAIGDQASWCNACGNTTGVCSADVLVGEGPSGSSGTTSENQGTSSSGGVSPAVGGVIGAMVTLAVVLGLEALILLAGGFRLVSKKRLAAPAAYGTEAKAS